MVRENTDGGGSRATTQDRRAGAERVEAAINTPSPASPFLRELDAITGPSGSNSANAASRTLDQVSRDGFLGRAEGLEAGRILDESRGSIWRHLPGTSNDISREDIRNHLNRPDLSAGDRELSTRLLRDFNNISTDHQRITPADIARVSATEQQHTDMRNLFSRDRSGQSLYDSVSNPGGGVDGRALERRLAEPNLSPQDRASLESVNRLRDASLGGLGSYTGDVSRDRLNDAAAAAGVTQAERNGRGTRQDAPRSLDAIAGQAAFTDLTARPRGGGQSLLDRVSDGQGGASIDRINNMLAHPGQNNLTERNIESLKYLQQNSPITPGSGIEGMPIQSDLSRGDLQRLGAAAGVNLDRLSARPGTQPTDEAQRGRDRDFAHLFERGRPGQQSLYDRIRNQDGSISASNIDQQLARPGLSQADRHSLDYVRSLASDGLLYGKRDISAADLQARGQDHHLSPEAMRRGGLTPTEQTQQPTTPRPGRFNSGQQQQGEMPATAHDALKVRAGEGYYHSAERLLSEAHRGQSNYSPSQQEMRNLVQQLRQANGNRRELRQNEELHIDQNIRTNPALQGLFH